MTEMNALLFSDQLTHDRDYVRLLDACQAPEARPISISGPTDSQKLWLMLALLEPSGRRPCLLVSDELRARSAAADIQALTGKTVCIFRPREINLEDADAVSREQERQRLSILASLNQPDIAALIVPASAAQQKLMPVSRFRSHCITVAVGESIDLDQLCERLVSLGYERMRQVDGAGQYARRGDIIDIVPASFSDETTTSGLRLSFFDTELDALKRFDLETQRSDEMLRQAVIPPAHEVIQDADEQLRLSEVISGLAVDAVRRLAVQESTRSAAATLDDLLRRDANRLREQMIFSGLDRWLHRVYPEAASVLDYAEDAGLQLFIDEPMRVRQRFDAAQAEFFERIRAMLEKGQILGESTEILWRGEDIAQRIRKIPGVISLAQIAAAGNLLPGSLQISLRGQSAERWRGREQAMAQRIRDWQDQRGETILFCGSEERVARMRGWLREQNLQIRLSEAGFREGFVWPAAGLMVIGMQDFFGSDRKARRRRTSHGLKIDLFSDLVPGEMVVHEAHGIGRYMGLVNLETNGMRRDYLHIQYSGDDALYLPMESLDQIQKYVGTDGRQPKLSRLGGQEWNRLKERARSSIRKLATDLVRLYAQRMAVKGHVFAADTVWQQEFEESFPYEETDDQIRAIQEIKTDMESEKVMDRLLCGDVGFGKTEVAFRAMFKCVMDGRQAILLAPTTVLAMQHYDNFKRRVADYPVEIGLLSRFAPESLQKKTLAGLQQGTVDVLIGTHRIFSKDVHIRNLGLLVVDEEQRFGVDHKEMIKAISPGVDVLTLTATPIPRTLHMAMSGIRDISVLEEPPHDRRPVQTYVMEFDQDIVNEAMLREISRHGQVFYLYNDTRRIIEKARSIETMLPGARVIYAHGKMGARRLEEVIGGFIAGEADILVCTTIIESGIDMPNVNTIIVENADHFGLAQLYQLRGRVGRSDRQAYAYVTYRRDRVLTEIAEKRLSAIRDFTELGSGFKIALRDLEVRGAGNLLGAEQHGQLEAIGYDLYCRMLEDTIREIRGEAAPVKINTVIELEVDAYLPPSYIPDEGERMDMYRRIADLSTLKDHQDLLDEWLDRYGEPPAQAVILADIAYIRAAAGRQGFSRIEQQHQHIRLNYDADYQPDMNGLSKILSDSAFRGRILFNAGTRPYLVYRMAASRRDQIASQLMLLFRQWESI